MAESDDTIYILQRANIETIQRLNASTNRRIDVSTLDLLQFTFYNV
jgi:hypothetical protein